jgi:NitT/TauT family transport system substrate-binding protein
MTAIHRRSFAAAVFAAALALGVTGGAAQAEPFRIITTDLNAQLVPNSVMDMAVDLGYFEREGVEVELVRVQQTPSAIAALQAGEGEMANVSVDAVLQLVARDQMEMKAVVSPNKSLPFLIAGRDDIDGLAGLEGRSFGIGRVGSLDHSLSAQVMRAGGTDPDAVEFVAVGQPSVRAQALAAGQIDATTMSIGVWLALPEKDGLAVIVEPDAYYAAAPVINKVNVVPDAVLAERRDEVEAVVRALIKASRDFSADPGSWVEGMVPARPDVDRATLEELGTAFVGAWSLNGGLNREELERTADWMYESPDFEGLRRVELDEWVDLSVIEAVLQEEGIAEDYDQPAF